MSLYRDVLDAIFKENRYSGIEIDFPKTDIIDTGQGCTREQMRVKKCPKVQDTTRAYPDKDMETNMIKDRNSVTVANAMLVRAK